MPEGRTTNHVFRLSTFIPPNFLPSAVLGLCLLLTAAHFAYACYAYEHASIIQFIARELW